MKLITKQGSPAAFESFYQLIIWSEYVFGSASLNCFYFYLGNTDGRAYCVSTASVDGLTKDSNEHCIADNRLSEDEQCRMNDVTCTSASNEPLLIRRTSQSDSYDLHARITDNEIDGSTNLASVERMNENAENLDRLITKISDAAKVGHSAKTIDGKKSSEDGMDTTKTWEDAKTSDCTNSTEATKPIESGKTDRATTFTDTAKNKETRKIMRLNNTTERNDAAKPGNCKEPSGDMETSKTKKPSDSSNVMEPAKAFEISKGSADKSKELARLCASEARPVSSDDCDTNLDNENSDDMATNERMKNIDAGCLHMCLHNRNVHGNKVNGCLCAKDQLERITSFGLNRDALDPVVSVEKLEPTGILSEELKRQGLSEEISCSHNSSDSITGSEVEEGCDNDVSNRNQEEDDWPRRKRAVDECEIGANGLVRRDPEENAMTDTISSSKVKRDEVDLKHSPIDKDDPAVVPDSQLQNEPGSVSLDACASDIIPKDEATKICDALLQTLSPVVIDFEPEDTFIVSIKLDKLLKRIQPKRASRSATRRLTKASRQQVRFSRRNKEQKMAESMRVSGNGTVPSKEVDSKKEVSVKEVIKKEDATGEASQKEELENEDSREKLLREESSKEFSRRREISKTVPCKGDVSKSENSKKEECDEKGTKKPLSRYKSLPTRTTRHSKKPIQEDNIPDKLVVSISLDCIDSYCQDEDKPECMLSTHTYSEGWMVQEEEPEAEGKKQFHIDEIFVDKKAFGLMKYRTFDNNGEVKEHLEILESRIAPANYIWPKDEDGRETGRLVPPDCMKDAMKGMVKVLGSENDGKEKVKDVGEEIHDEARAVGADKTLVEEAMEEASSSNKDPSDKQSSEFKEEATMLHVDDFSCNFEAKRGECSQAVKVAAAGISVSSDPVEDTQKTKMLPKEVGDVKVSGKSMNVKDKVKLTKTRQRSLENSPRKQAVTRKTRSQAAKDVGKEKVNASDMEPEKAVAVSQSAESTSDDTEIAPRTKFNGESGSHSVTGDVKSKKPLPTDESLQVYENEVRTDGENESAIAAKMEALICKYSLGEGEVAASEAPKNQNAKEEKLRGKRAAGPESIASNPKKLVKESKSRRRKADDVSTRERDRPNKVLRPRRGVNLPDPHPKVDKEEKNCDEGRDEIEGGTVKDNDGRKKSEGNEAKDKLEVIDVSVVAIDKSVDVEDVPCKPGPTANESSLFFEKELVGNASDRVGVIEKCDSQQMVPTELVTASNAKAVDIESHEDEVSTEESTLAKEKSIEKPPDVQLKSSDKSIEDAAINGKGIEDSNHSEDGKTLNKNEVVTFSPNLLDVAKTEEESCENSSLNDADEDFNDIHRNSVTTSIMSSIGTSLNRELFGMSSCDLEFTLPGMSKDVLVKVNGSVVKSNEIEDCLRLPPVDGKRDIIRDSGELACSENPMLHPDIRHRQAMLPASMQIDCLSPYGDTSKFFHIHPEESNSGDFETGQIQGMDKRLEGNDAFLNGDSMNSPFRQRETEVSLKLDNQIEGSPDKWDREAEGTCLINKPQMAELLDDPFMNSDEIRSGSHPDDSLLPEVENFAENDIENSPCDDDKYDLPDSQFENVDIPTQSFECEQELVESQAVDIAYNKVASEGYSSGSSTEDDDEDEDSDSSETDTDSSSSSSSRSDDDDDDDDDDTEEESDTSDSDSDVNEELKNEEPFIDDESKSDVPSPTGEVVGKEPFIPVKVEEVVFQDDEILPIERKECREFFMGKLSKTPEKYLSIRKFIIKGWNKIRPAYLTKNSIRSKVDPTDANAVGRVFMLLENIGAINVGCSVKNKWVERMERRRVKYFNSKRTESVDSQTDDQKRKRGRPPTLLTKETKEREIFLDFNVITNEERRANPQFFNGNKNKSPEKYLKMRNSIINCWMDSKPTYLTKQAARMAMSWYCGDVNAISRVHDYLEQIGAINFGCAQEPRRGRPSRARMNQDRTKSGPKSKELKRDKEKLKDVTIDSKAARMRNAQKKLEDISREVEMEMGKPLSDNEIISYDAYSASNHQPNTLSSDTVNDLIMAKQKSRRGRKPKIRQCEPDSTVHDENLLSEKDSTPVAKNGLIPVKEMWESGPASDKSSVGDSGFDSVSEISPLLESEPTTLSMKPSLAQEASMVALEDENYDGSYPMPTEEKVLDISMITAEEKLGCPEFFVGSRVKPPEKYVKIRDSILRSWHNKKPFYLNKHNARCDMPWYTGDINSIGRVHAYLERIGAINYGAVHRPKRSGRVPMCRKRKLTDSPRYEAPSPETEEDDELSDDKMNYSQICSDDPITQEESEAFKRLLAEGNCINDLPNSQSTVRDVMSEMWAKCKQKYLAKPRIDLQYAEDFVDDDDVHENNDSDSDAGDDSYIDNRTLINGAYSETGKNGVWDMTKTFSLGLRPRKRWKMDINQDWIDRTESEGFTIKVFTLSLYFHVVQFAVSFVIALFLVFNNCSP